MRNACIYTYVYACIDIYVYMIHNICILYSTTSGNTYTNIFESLDMLYCHAYVYTHTICSMCLCQRFQAAYVEDPRLSSGR